MYVCIYNYVFFFVWYFQITRASTNNLDMCETNCTFQEGGVALTNSADSSSAHTHCGTKGNKLKRRWEWEREARYYQSEYKKEEARLEVRII